MSAITKRTGYLVAILLTLSGLSGCVHNPSQQSEPIAKRPVVKKIALVAVMEPARLTVENRGGALNFLAFPGYVVKKNMESNRADDLTVGLRGESLNLGGETSAALQEELQRMGYEVALITKVRRQPDDPTDIDFQSIKTDANAILTAHYTDAGLFSGHSSTNYVPRLRLDVRLVMPDGEDDLYSQAIEYGAHAKKRTEDEIPSDPKYAYGTFAEAMEKQPEIVEGFRIGIHQLAALVAQQIRQAGL